MGKLKQIPGGGRSLCFAMAKLNPMECKERNRESVMNFFKGVQAYGLFLKILELNLELVSFFFEFSQFQYVFCRKSLYVQLKRRGRNLE